jgi:hypothetical protein
LFSKDTVFGESMAKKFAIGDIVSWPSLDKSNSYEKIKKIGIVSEIITVTRSERPVIIAKIIDMETSKQLDVLVVSLTIVSKANKEIQN